MLIAVVELLLRVWREVRGFLCVFDTWEVGPVGTKEVNAGFEMTARLHLVRCVLYLLSHGAFESKALIC